MTSPMRVDVYWNLHKRCWSVRHKGRVIDHTGLVILNDVTWVVQPAGNARVRAQGRKNVHAFARGVLVDPDTWTGPTEATRQMQDSYTALVTYNPYRDTSFIDKSTGKPIRHSALAMLVSINDHPRVEAMGLT